MVKTYGEINPWAGRSRKGCCQALSDDLSAAPAGITPPA
jgi:hypothetical protein